MPKVSKQSAPHFADMGPLGEDRHDDLDGYTANFVSLLHDSDLGPMLVLSAAVLDQEAGRRYGASVRCNRC
jgi:hypothetical protein